MSQAFAEKTGLVDFQKVVLSVTFVWAKYCIVLYSLYLPSITILLTYTNKNRPSSYFINRILARGKEINLYILD